MSQASNREGHVMDRKAIDEWVRGFRRQRGLTDDDPVSVSLPSPTYGPKAPRREAGPKHIRPVNVTQYARVNGPANEKYVVEDGKYRRNRAYNPPFDITLGQAIAGPALIGAAGGAIAALPPAVLAGLAAGGIRAGTAMNGAARLVGSYPPKVTEALNAPYPARAMGEHVIPRRYAKRFPILAPLINHRANILRRPTKGEMYELHFKCDQGFKGARLPRGLEEAGWSGQRAGLEKNGPLRWMWECTTPEMKAAAGLAAAGTAAATYGATRDEPSSRSPR